VLVTGWHPAALVVLVVQLHPRRAYGRVRVAVMAAANAATMPVVPSCSSAWPCSSAWSWWPPGVAGAGGQGGAGGRVRWPGALAVEGAR
jgi:hypothetical protein